MLAACPECTTPHQKSARTGPSPFQTQLIADIVIEDRLGRRCFYFHVGGTFSIDLLFPANHLKSNYVHN